MKYEKRTQGRWPLKTVIMTFGAIVVAAVTYVVPRLLGTPVVIETRPELVQAPASSSDDTPETLRAPFLVETYYVPSGWVGDGERGTRHVELDSFYRGIVREGDADGVITKVVYRPGPVGWAGVYWQRPEKNWGNRPGPSVIANRVSFSARGDKGGEIVEFRVGGIGADGLARHRDTVNRSTGRVSLSTAWQGYEIDLAEQDLSHVSGGFAWIAVAAAQSGELLFYIDEIRYE